MEQMHTVDTKKSIDNVSKIVGGRVISTKNSRE